MNSNKPFTSGYRGVAPGTRLNGIYEIDEMIGAGGMGEVYKCHEIQTGAAVAIKMLLPEMAENEAALGAFPQGSGGAAQSACTMPSFAISFSRSNLFCSGLIWPWSSSMADRFRIFWRKAR